MDNKTLAKTVFSNFFTHGHKSYRAPREGDVLATSLVLNKYQTRHDIQFVISKELMYTAMSKEAGV